MWRGGVWEKRDRRAWIDKRRASLDAKKRLSSPDVVDEAMLALAGESETTLTWAVIRIKTHVKVDEIGNQSGTLDFPAFLEMVPDEV
jgi:hypothetical protein